MIADSLPCTSSAIVSGIDRCQQMTELPGVLLDAGAGAAGHLAVESLSKLGQLQKITVVNPEFAQ